MSFQDHGRDSIWVYPVPADIGPSITTASFSPTPLGIGAIINSILYVSLNTVISVSSGAACGLCVLALSVLGRQTPCSFWLLTNRMAPAAVFALPFFQLVFSG